MKVKLTHHVGSILNELGTRCSDMTHLWRGTHIIVIFRRASEQAPISLVSSISFF